MARIKRKIVAVTGSRADYGLLRWTLKTLESSIDFELHVVATGSHLSKRFGNTLTEIEQDGYSSIKSVPILHDSDGPEHMAKSIGTAVISFTDMMLELKPDTVLLLGDRFEILAAAITAFTLRIPIAHIHGGEITSGALDDGYRHAITKLSALHFVAAEEYQKRVIQMGENPSSTFIVGTPGLESLHRIKYSSLSELSKLLNFKIASKDYVVVAYHPETVLVDDGILQFKQVLDFLKSEVSSKYKILFSKSNADSGGREIGDLIDGFVSKNTETSASFFSLGQTNFLSLLKESKMFIGNSSSGIIEAPALKIPTLNIGNRQEGRLMASTIIQSSADLKDLKTAFQKADQLSANQNASMPYGTGENVSEKIVSILQSSDLKSLKKKNFYDLAGRILS